MELFKPLSILDPGKRENMEDCIFPPHGTATEADRFFIVCDGMGGHTKGEVASQLACDGFADYFRLHPVPELTEQYFRDAFDHVQELFDQYLRKNREARGMGTTAVIAVFSEDSVAVAHCGDSRCYHFRGPELLWRTKDHKLVEEWVEKGYITAREALHHSRSNIITRAIQGTMIAYTRPDVHIISDLKPGDYLFLCSDGVYESFEDHMLLEIMASGLDDAAKTETVYKTCYRNSTDNFSAYLLKIK